MKSKIDRLTSLTVTDVMSRKVVTIESQQSMREVAEVFLGNQISGAPVVDEQGRCLGMLSALDFVRRERSQCREEASALGMQQHAIETQPRNDCLEIVGQVEDRASAYMSSSLQSIQGSASLIMAARVMCAQHIHRLPVLDEAGRPLGVLTSIDVVAAMLNVYEESNSSSETGS